MNAVVVPLVSESRTPPIGTLYASKAKPASKTARLRSKCGGTSSEASAANRSERLDATNTERRFAGDACLIGVCCDELHSGRFKSLRVLSALLPAGLLQVGRNNFPRCPRILFTATDLLLCTRVEERPSSSHGR
eukprot:1193806-Prorocentrum_minimum.AAC.5